MMNLIRDRTEYDVYLLTKLRSKGWANMTASERNTWSNHPKGAYNHTDLNRVESTVRELADIYELDLTTKTDWTQWDIPTQSDMERYLGNITQIRDLFADTTDMPTIPESMNKLTYQGANNIEEILYVGCIMTGEILSSISVTYSGDEVFIGTSLDKLTGVTVTANYSDGSSEVVTAYTLSGKIAEGDNVITVSYGIRNATFVVVGRIYSGTLGRAVLDEMTLGTTV